MTETAKAGVNSEQALLEEAAKRLVLALDPEHVYLFGSRARGDYHADSDYDLMVIVEDDRPDYSKLADIGRKALSGSGLSYDLKVYSHTKFHKQLHLKASMPSAVLRDGKLLYEAGRYACDQPALFQVDSAVGEGPPQAPLDPVLIENISDWLKKAKKDILVADYELDGSDDMLDDVMFHCQQAVEKAIKAFLTRHDQVFPKTHELGELAKLCVLYESDLKTAIDQVDWLSRWAIDGRYPGEASAQREEAEDALRQTRAFFESIFMRLPVDV